jgi:hypothetical protein
MRRAGGAAEPGSWNRFGYVGGDPVNYADPQGLYSVDPSFGCVNSQWFFGNPEACFSSWSSIGMGNDMCDSPYSKCWDVDTSSPGYHNCVTNEGLSCLEVDDARRFYSRFTAEGCSAAQVISTPQACEDGTIMAAATPLFRALRRGAGFAWYAAAQAVGRYGEAVVGRILGLERNAGAMRVVWEWAGKKRIPDFVDEVKRIAYEVKYVGFINITQQIIDTAAAARANGYQYVIYLYHGAYNQLTQKQIDQFSEMGVKVGSF